jgi:hypothetical protein
MSPQITRLTQIRALTAGRSPKYSGIFLLIWLSGTVSGFFLLEANHAGSGQTGKPLVSLRAELT